MTSLPFLIRLITAIILAQQNKALLAEVAFLRTKISFLREQIPKEQNLRFTDAWRKKHARAAAGVGWKRRAETASVATASIIRGGHRLMNAGKLGVKRTGPGRPLIEAKVVQTVIRLVQENPT